MQANYHQQLDEMDKKLLNDIQWVFPLADRPYLEIAKNYNISEDEVMQRISGLKGMGLIRQINAIFDTRRLGYKSALIAFAVAPEKLDAVAEKVNEHPGVSHNYERNHEYNMWFTLAVPPDSDMKGELDRMSALDGVVKYRLLPTLKMYKIGVKLDMVNGDAEKPKPTDEVKELNPDRLEITERDKEFVRELQKDLPVVREPFREMAQNLGITTAELFSRAREYEKEGLMRRFAAILRHRDAGFVANGMVVWNVPEDRVDDVGFKLAAFPQVSHCYRRPVYPDWKYNVFSMVHARSLEAAEKMAVEMSGQIGISDYKILFSSREFKKERVKYFV
ncbi:siroheme decarboxylase subunit alpha [Nitrososphaera viennensis]|uniref:siroheme decarboxylase n=2 Tax=Nitrososphaera viennensis TaxID=1034015 RepID=A0A060HP22_9ARCH|nr:Lrp/AsnC family transcriptional regulator [Nitrososphaera viennensis]AIC17243.1 putative transcriptional regulator, AsnC family [Nitrososphaera viennensis EN76]UVS69127.1 Lrp/AsnC family transcriptional regulator [Nitrososphaera viennensis]